MSDLPQGWTLTTFGKLFDFKGGSQPPKSTFRDTAAPGYVRLLQIRDFESDAKAVFIKDHYKWPKCSAEDIMIGRYGASVGKILGGKAGAYNVALVRMIFDHDNLHPGWVKQLLRSAYFQNPLANISRSAQNGFNKSDLESIDIPLPPLPEQRRIVTRIDSLTSKSRRACDHLDHIPRLVEKYKQAILAAAFRGDLTREWRGLASKYDIEWETHELGDIADIGTGATPKRGRTDYYEGGTIAWVTSGTVNEGIITHADEYITPAALNETNCKTYPAGTLLMAMYGEGKTRGKVAILGIEAATNQALAAIQVRRRGPASPSFVLWYLRSQYLSLRDQAAGGVQPNLNLGIIKRTSIDLPSSSEQDEIVRRIEAAFAWVNRLTADAASARKLVNNLDQAVLAKAFRGELVPQDPADEPASALLERIRAERASAPKVKRGRRKVA